MIVDFATFNPIFLGAFGESYTLTRSEDLLDETPTTEAFTAIPSQLTPEETNAPGDGSTYLILWISCADFTDLPAKGDQVSTGTTKYLIADITSDGTAGLYLKCRKSGDV